MMKKYIAILAACTLLCSCDAWLEDYEDTANLNDKAAWVSEETADLYLNGFYTYIHKYGQYGGYQFSGSLTESLTDTFKYGSIALGSKAGDPNEYVINPDKINSSSCLYSVWDTAYENIRRINGFLESMKLYSTLSEEKNTLLEAQARFFRGFIHFQLAKRHPEGIIIFDHRTTTNNNPLATPEEMWKFIKSDFNFAAEHLPETWSKSADQGRLTKVMAYGMLSRVMLYAKDWQAAYDAADSVIARTSYGLVDDYAQAWKGHNKEAIIEFDYDIVGPNHWFDKDYVPMCDGYEYGSLGTPTQEMVESYEKADGTTFDWSAWHVGNIKTRPDYESLEPRFHATVIYNGSYWKGKKMDCSVDGMNGEWMDYASTNYSYGKTTTGYFLRKLLDESHTDIRSVASTQPWVELRYAEVLLNKAEAAYMLNKPAAEYQEPMNQVRARVGLPPKTTSGKSWLFDYYAERKVELAFEGQYFWDLRRWKMAHIQLDGYKCHGMKIENGAFKYVSCDLDNTTRVFPQKLYNLPIPDSEIKNNHAIEQFNDWK